MTTTPFPDLPSEQAHLDHARHCRDRMLQRFAALDPSASADEITEEYIEVRVADAIDGLRAPGAGDFFGRIDDQHVRWYLGRRHIEDELGDPVVVDWRAPIAAPFYRATSADPLGVRFRRRYTLEDGQLIAYLDEHLDDPDEGAIAGGIPDPVLAEIGAARAGEMREIVATIQGEQDVVIRSPIDQVLIVQGGPGTGKTSVALHRAAFLLFEHRARLARDGVLVVGPNRAFLDYVGNVLPSLGERSVRQVTVEELCIPRIEIGGEDDAESARWKGAPERVAELEAAAHAVISAPTEDVRVPFGARTHVIARDLFAEWVDAARAGTSPLNERRERLRVLARRELLRRTGRDESWSAAGPLKSAINRAWPTQQPARLVDRFLPGPSGKRRVWTPADQLLVDEANSILNGTPFSYGHVVVDEAQDHSAVGLRVIGRRSPTGSMTLVGDVAQSTAPAGQERWSDVSEHLDTGAGRIVDLTIGYRVPGPILDIANRLLPLTAVDAAPSRSVRTGGRPPAWHVVERAMMPEVVSAVVAELRTRHRLTGVVASTRALGMVREALHDAGLIAVEHLHGLDPAEVPLFGPAQVKGLEFDGVVVVDPDSILGGADDASDGGGPGATAITPLGARLLYVAMTRAVQELAFVADRAAPAVLAPA